MAVRVAKPATMNLLSLLGQFRAGTNTHHIAIPPTWHQGRTAYGGLSSVLAYQAAKMADADLPPLQSAQIAFVGPLAGDVEVTATVMRRGKNTAFVKSEISGSDGVGMSCTFIFMNRRHSHLDYEALNRPEFPPIPSAETARSGPSEYFTGHMQYPDKRLELGMATSRLASWHRFTEHEGLDHIAELICIGDALPPSAMGLMTEKGMVSSMNWQINMLTDAPATKDGWWYLESETHHAANGASSQYMTAWNSDGQPVLTGMQSVAIFV
jgi:acyl-CoA thioesterase